MSYYLGNSLTVVSNRFNWPSLFIFLFWILTAICPLVVTGSTPALIEQYDEKAVCGVLEEEVPELTIHTVKFFSPGDHLVVEVNGKWIFRFPLKEEFIPVIEREKILLDRLHNNVSMVVPRYEYIGSRTAFVGYKKVIGDALDGEFYFNLKEEVRQSIAESLALFLSQFHRAISVDEAIQWGYKKYHLPLAWIENELVGTLPSKDIERMVNEALVFAKQNPFPEEKLALLHNDLHGENLAFDLATELITGVFDFSDAVIGDYSVEFGKLFTIHPELAIRTSEAYGRRNKLPNPIIPAAMDYILRRASYILYARERGDELRESRLLKTLDTFIPIWDDITRRFSPC